MSLVAASVLIVCGLFAVSATTFPRSDMSTRLHGCRRCSSLEECFLPPGEGCNYGQFQDNCGYVNCYRGPGEVCTHSGTKRCTDTLACLCGKCTGCVMGSGFEPECYIHSTACTNNFV